MDVFFHCESVHFAAKHFAGNVRQRKGTASTCCIMLHHVPRERRTQDNRMSVAVLCKAAQGEHWRRLFRGDPDGARCLLPPYRLAGHFNP